MLFWRSILKGKNLFLEEQILSIKIRSHFCGIFFPIQKVMNKEVTNVASLCYRGVIHRNYDKYFDNWTRAQDYNHSLKLGKP